MKMQIALATFLLASPAMATTYNIFMGDTVPSTTSEAIRAKIEEPSRLQRWRLAVQFMSFEEGPLPLDDEARRNMSNTDFNNQTHDYCVQAGCPQTTVSDSQGDFTYYTSANGTSVHTLMPTLSVGYAFIEQLGVNVFAGIHEYNKLIRHDFIFGGELEVTPARLRVFNVEHAIEPILLVGGGDVRGFDTKWYPYFGAKLNVFFNENWGLNATWRKNFTAPDFTMIGGGLTARL